MSPQQRKKLFNRGTFLLCDGEKYDVSNIVHESTEVIPDEVTVVIRKCAWADHLYPRLDSMDADMEENGNANNVNDKTTRYGGSFSSEESSAHHEESFSSSIHSGRFAADDDEAFCKQQHQSFASINWTSPENAELLKMVERSGGPATVHGAVHVDGDQQHTSASAAPQKRPPSLIREESKPLAAHVDGPGVNEASTEPSRRDSMDYMPDAKLSPARGVSNAKRSSFSMDSYFPDNRRAWEQQQQQQEDGESWTSDQIKAAAAAFDSCNVAPPSEQSMVQVTDTLEFPLHGANETIIALETGNVVTVVCVVCRARLRCIAIAQYVLCPECKCLTPLENNTTKATGGVGLGLLSTYDQSFRVSTS